MTLAVAARFGTRRMTGYDIDGALIKKACRWEGRREKGRTGGVGWGKGAWV